MEVQIRKKKKAESHKVTLRSDKLNKGSFPVSGTQNAHFPYEPYPEQKVLIQTINQAIKNKQNALIQSPTGTGKTLSVLVGSLSSLCSLSSQEGSKIPKIYYLTRTHSQITQVINELKRIQWYKCRINIIASRQHLCINRNLKQLKGRLLDKGCQEMCQKKLCRFKQEVSDNSTSVGKQWLTLEELCEKGNKNNFCPFYYTKMMTEKSQITIMPFNYLLDWNLFEHNNFNIKNSVIIFDEAHNVDSLAEEGSSLEIDTEGLTQALNQLKTLEQSSKCRYLHKKFDTENDNYDFEYVGQAKHMICRLISNLKEFHQQKNMIEVYDMLDQIKKLTNYVYQQQQFPGMNLDNYQQKLYQLQKVKKLFNSKKIQSQQFDLFYFTLSRIMKLMDSNHNQIEDYYMSLGPKNQRGAILKLNCLNASFTFQRLMNEKPRSIILCSGTLGPLDIWQKQLSIPFQNKLKVASFISNRQICVDVISHSSNKDKTRFQFSYQNRSRDDQFQALGFQLKQIEQIIPNGIVVAFSTYDLMQRSMKFCLGLKKPVFFESKTQNINQVYAKFCESARSNKGAFLFIVMKGKFSQGINFSGQLCRCMIVVGIPFLPPHEFRIIRKKAYLSGKFGKEEAENWYYSQTFKAVNQVIGRVIRSKSDYGSVLFFDQRYNRKDIKKQLPCWLAENLPKEQFVKKSYIKRVSQFFKNQSWAQACPQEDTQFDPILEKTIVANERSNTPQFEELLSHETPIKLNKPKKMLQILEDEELPTFDDCNGKKNEKKEQTIETTKQKPKRTVFPWFSLDYFLSNTECFNIQGSNQENPEEDKSNSMVTLSMFESSAKAKKKSYL